MCCNERYQIITIFLLHCTTQTPFEILNTSRKTLIVPMKFFLIEYGFTSKITTYVKEEGILNTIIFALTSVVSCLPL
jgi:hypothetical protein